MYLNNFTKSLLCQNLATKLVTQMYCKNSTLSSFTAYNLANCRSLVKITGKDSAKYLQNLITNDINLLNETNIKSLYAMILNNRGRVLHDVLVYGLNKENTDEKTYLVEVDKMYLNDFLKMLKIYKIKKKVEVSSVDSEFKLFSLVNDTTQDKPEELIFKETTADNNGAILVPDPRFSQLGYRFITQSTNVNVLDCFVNRITDKSDDSLYKQSLYKHGIAENHDNISYGSSIPLEYNIVLLNGVSFSKGCYLGQELIAKTHHTGVIRKRIVPIEFSDETNNIQFKADSNILNIHSGKSAGKLKGRSGKFGIAMLRISELVENGLVILDDENKPHPIKYKIPQYWNQDVKLMQSLLKN